jgi:hypothetical protein
MGGSGSWWQNQARCSRQSQYDLDVQRPHRGDLSTSSHRGGRGPPRSNDRGGRSPFQDDDDQERRRAPAEPPKAPAGQGEGEGEAAGLRVNKIFARFASRREADRMVVAGRVKINGKVGPLSNDENTHLSFESCFLLGDSDRDRDGGIGMTLAPFPSPPHALFFSLPIHTFPHALCPVVSWRSLGLAW